MTEFCELSVKEIGEIIKKRGGIRALESWVNDYERSYDDGDIFIDQSSIIMKFFGITGKKLGAMERRKILKKDNKYGLSGLSSSRVFGAPDTTQITFYFFSLHSSIALMVDRNTSEIREVKAASILASKPNKPHFPHSLNLSRPLSYYLKKDDFWRW